MVLFYLTNVALDISLGLAWWGIKNATYVVYNGITYVIYGKEIKPDRDVIIMNEIADLKKEIMSFKNNL